MSAIAVDARDVQTHPDRPTAVVHVLKNADFWVYNLTYHMGSDHYPQGVEGTTVWGMATAHLVLAHHDGWTAVLDYGGHRLDEADAAEAGHIACMFARLAAGERVAFRLAGLSEPGVARP